MVEKEPLMIAVVAGTTSNRRTAFIICEYKLLSAPDIPFTRFQLSYYQFQLADKNMLIEALIMTNVQTQE